MKGLFRTEDWWAVWIGLLIFGLSLGVAAGFDLLGWGVTIHTWSDPGKALAVVSPRWQVAPLVGLAGIYLFLLVALSIGARAMQVDLRRFMIGFTIVFWLSYASWFLGHNGYIAATTDAERSRLHIGWSLRLTNEGGYILALVLGLAIGNLLPGPASYLKEAARPEWFVKTAIVILGASLGVKAAGEASQAVLAKAILFRGFAAIVEAYLIYWALVYWIARRFFKFNREWAAPLASGISICGVSAAIATGAAIRARPVVPIMVSSLVVIFAVVELLILPFCAQAFLGHEPMVASAWMGLAVKTDGAAVASGAITEALISANAEARGVVYDRDWMVNTTTAVKVFIDIFIGIWAFVLAIIWVYYIDKKPGERVRPVEIWQRFPKFVLGYFCTFVLLFVLVSLFPNSLGAFKDATKEGDIFRTLFFAMTFFSIGLAANFKKLWEEGIGRLALVYVISLFGFIIWIGLAISFVFFQGVHPPLKG